ncbi:hypothetical protein LX36DRAFT_655176 [Colletotrichum falcatum]|nr:hypothetical protein LX36DRAFT_655176 [Colletotrichum falcatum]
MKASVISSLIVALAGVLVTASPTPDSTVGCLRACMATCAAEGKVSKSSISQTGGHSIFLTR